MTSVTLYGKYVYDRPKSPWARWFMYSQYWLHSEPCGVPSIARMARTWARLSWASLPASFWTMSSAGSPG